MNLYLSLFTHIYIPGLHSNYYEQRIGDLGCEQFS